MIIHINILMFMKLPTSPTALCDLCDKHIAIENLPDSIT